MDVQPSRPGREGSVVYLLREIEKFLSSNAIAATRFGRDAVGDPRFVFDLRRGREPRERTIRKVRRYIEAWQ